MKFSEMNTDETLNILCELTPYVGKIAEDKEILKIFSEKVKLDSEATETEYKEVVLETTIKKVSKFIPILLKTHRNSVYNILSILNQKSVDDIKNQNISLTIKELKELILDADFLNFFQELLK